MRLPPKLRQDDIFEEIDLILDINVTINVVVVMEFACNKLLVLDRM